MATAAPAPTPVAQPTPAPVQKVVQQVTVGPKPELPDPDPPQHGPIPWLSTAPDSSLLALAPQAGAGLMLGSQKVNAVSLAVEFGRAGYGWAGTLVFNVWLRRQLRERRMTQRQLAALSGVNHSTISRMLSNGRAPSLETATKLAHALRHRWSDEEVAAYFDLLADRPILPTQRVESALRGDDDLGDEDVMALMEQYLMVRARRREARNGGAAPASLRSLAADRIQRSGQASGNGKGVEHERRAGAR